MSTEMTDAVLPKWMSNTSWRCYCIAPGWHEMHWTHARCYGCNRSQPAPVAVPAVGHVAIKAGDKLAVRSDGTGGTVFSIATSTHPVSVEREFTAEDFDPLATLADVLEAAADRSSPDADLSHPDLARIYGALRTITTRVITADAFASTRRGAEWVLSHGSAIELALATLESAARHEAGRG
jgi:hypothetical protein